MTHLLDRLPPQESRKDLREQLARVTAALVAIAEEKKAGGETVDDFIVDYINSRGGKASTLELLGALMRELRMNDEAAVRALQACDRIRTQIDGSVVLAAKEWS